MSFFVIKDKYGIVKEIPIVKAPAGTDAYQQASSNGFSGGQAAFQTNLAGMTNPYKYKGAVFMASSLTANPITLFGGNWERIDSRFILASSSAHPLEELGGESMVTLTVENLPSHSHSQDGARFSGSKSYVEYYVRSDPKYHGLTDSYGGSQPHNNMPPYEKIYAWRRTDGIES